VLVKGNKETFLDWIGKALKASSIRMSEEIEPISWKLARSFPGQPALPPQGRAVEIIQPRTGR
jgi:hypothetical protein